MFNHIIISITYILLVDSASAPTHFMITRAGPCLNSPQTAVIVSEMSLSIHMYDCLVSGELNITDDIEDGWTVKVTIQKCVDIRNQDSCDFFRTFWLVRHGCTDEDEDELEMCSMMFHYATPKLECPLQTGRYKIINYPLFSEDNYLQVHESKISTSIFGYTYALEGFTVDKRKIFCVEAHLQLVYIREHDWIRNVNIEVTTSGPSSSGEEAHEPNNEENVNENIY